MNQLEKQTLIDENEIRHALKPWRHDAATFSSGVRRRIEFAANKVNDIQRSAAIDSFDTQHSDWLRIAASIAPIHLLGHSIGANIAPISFAAISLGKKLVVVLAFPFLCFFMIGLTAIGALRIRAAQNGQRDVDLDVEQARQATSRWWKRYGWIAAIVFLCTLVSPFFGWTTPLMIALVCSGVAAVSFVRTMAKENLVERGLVGGACVAGLGLLGQLSVTFSINSHQILDSNLVTGVLFAGSFAIGASIRPRAFVGGILVAGVIMAICTQSYWRGITALDIQKHVESFDSSKLGLWDDWADAADWLNEIGVGYDKKIARENFQKDLDKDPRMRARMLTAATRSGLIQEAEMLTYTDVQADRTQLADPQLTEQPILNLEGEYFRVASIAADPARTTLEQDVLAKRLMVNWSQLVSSDFDYKRLKSALLLTELFNRLDRVDQIEQRTADVHRWLVEAQITEPAPFRSGGGFLITDQAPDSDRRATVAAISLMQTYGVPTGLDIRLLRSYLRPNFIYDFLAYDYVPKNVARDKLDRLANVPRLTGFDYLQTELPLWLSILLVFLLAYATLSSPVRGVALVAQDKA